MPHYAAFLVLVLLYNMEPAHLEFLRLASQVAGIPLEESERLANNLLPVRNTDFWNSTLNNDGSPLQICVSLRSDKAKPSVRLIVDPGSGIAEEEDRRHRTSRAIERLVDSHGSDMRYLCNSLVESMLPSQPGTCTLIPGSGLWVAADLSGKGMAVYATTKWGANEQRWNRARRWLGDILPETGLMDSVVDRILPRTILVSAGIEGIERHGAIAKLYWRLDGSATFNDLGIPFIENHGLREFFSLVIENQKIPKTGILGSIGFQVGTGRVTSTKLDICCHCVRRTPHDWARVLQYCATYHDPAKTPLSYSNILERSEMAFLGFGLDALARPRLNVYLKPIVARGHPCAEIQEEDLVQRNDC
jgi:hypothetical protein